MNCASEYQVAMLALVILVLIYFIGCHGDAIKRLLQPCQGTHSSQVKIGSMGYPLPNSDPIKIDTLEITHRSGARKQSLSTETEGTSESYHCRTRSAFQPPVQTASRDCVI